MKYHDFPREGTLSTTRLGVVRESVEQSSEAQKGCCGCARHGCGKCEQTVYVWLEEVDRKKRKNSERIHGTIYE